MEEREKDIDLKDMCIMIIMKWKWMLLVGIAMAAGLAGFKYLKDSSGKTKSDELETKLSTMEKEMTSAEYNNAQTYISLYENLDMMRQDRLSRKLYQVDPYHEKSLFLTYAVKLKNDEELTGIKKQDDGAYLIAEHLNDQTVINQIATLYANKICDDELVSEIDKALADISENDIRSLVTSANIAMNSTTNTNGLVYVKIIIIDGMDAEKVAEIIKSNLEVYTEEIQNIKAHEIVLVDESYREIVDNDLVSSLNTLASREYNFQTQINTLEGSLGDVEKNYIALYFDNKKLKNQESIDKSVEINKKMIVIGFAGGIILFCVFAAVGYSVSGKVRTVDTLSNYYGLRMFGTQSLNNKTKRGIKKWLYNLKYHNEKKLTPDEQKEIIISGIKIYCEQNNLEKLIISGSEIENIDEEYLNELSDKLTDLGIEVETVKNIYYYPESLRKATDVSNVLLFEILDMSAENEVERLIKKTKEYNINIVGAVAITEL